MSTGSLNLGGNLSIAVGPIGRNAEATGSINKLATMYSYSRTRGLFGGASLEGSVIFERNDANEKAYAGYVDDEVRGVSAKTLLSGQIEPPPWAATLINALEHRAGTHFDQNWIDDQPSDFEERRNRGYSFGGDYAARSSDGPKISPKDTLGKGRLRGYSLGSFGRSKSSSGRSSPAEEISRRNRSYTSSSSPGARKYRDNGNNSNTSSDNDDDRNEEHRQDRDIEAYNSPEPDRYDIPPSPSSTTSSKSQRFSDFLKRPVLPNRSSASAVAAVIRSRASPLGGRSRSDSKSSKAGKSIGEWPATASSEDEQLEQDRPRDMKDTRKESTFATHFSSRSPPDSPPTRDDGNESSIASPFEDRFSPVEQRFRTERHAGERENRTGKTAYNGEDAPVDRSPSPSFQKKKKKKSSLLGSAASALARPLARRSATAPVVRHVYDSDQEDDDEDELGSRYKSFDNRGDRDFFPDRNRVSHSTGRSAASSDMEDDNEAGFIAIHRNPFEDSSNATGTTAPPRKAPTSYSSNSGVSGKNIAAHDTRDLLSTLDEDEPITSSSFSSMEQPRHRLDLLYSKDNHDTRSIRSIDSNVEFTFGDKTHKLRQVTNDLQGKESKPKYSLDKKESRMATFDFAGGEVCPRPSAVA